MVLPGCCPGPATGRFHPAVAPVECFWVDVFKPCVRWQCDDGERRNYFTLEIPPFVKAGEGDSAVRGTDVVALFAAFGASPLMKATRRNNRALGLEAFLPERAGAKAADPCIESAVLLSIDNRDKFKH